MLTIKKSNDRMRINLKKGRGKANEKNKKI